jgi:multicomponent Na+:H+ antiporter subunit E
MSIPAQMAFLVALWLLAWGEATPANLASGVAVAGAVLVAFPPARRAAGRVRVSAIGAVRLAIHVAVQLVTSNVMIAREILRRRPDTRSGVIAHRLRHPSDEIVTVVSSIIALSPGTMVVDVGRNPPTIYVHVLLLRRDIDSARRTIARIEQLAAAAIAVRPPTSYARPTPPQESP